MSSLRTMRNPVKRATDALGIPEAKRAQSYGGFRRPQPAPIAQAKARQSSKIREFEVALRRVGLISLDEQARALDFARLAVEALPASALISPRSRAAAAGLWIGRR